MELQGRLADIRKAGMGLAAISYDSPELLSSFSRQHGITFPLLSDAGSATIKRYGIVNTVADEAVSANRNDPALAADVNKYVSLVNPNAVMLGMAFPGTFIVYRNGRVRSRFFEAFYRERYTASSVMMPLDGRAGSVAGTRIYTEPLEINTYATDAAVAFGNRFALVLEITPRRGIHVYAPGASAYRVIALTLAPQPFVRVLESPYPASQIYVFKPLNERVPVYQRMFTLRQEVLLEGSPDAQMALRGADRLMLTGALNYQACDDNVCFNPTSVPLSWTLRLQPLITERPK